MKEDYVVKRINQLCAEREWTPYRLAVESGIPHSTLHNMLHRSSVPSLLSLDKVCGAFGISLAQFFQTDCESMEYLSVEESALIGRYRRLAETDRKIVSAYVQGFADRNS